MIRSGFFPIRHLWKDLGKFKEGENAILVWNRIETC